MKDSSEVRIAVIGQKDSVLAFRALGMDIFFTDENDGQVILSDLVKQGYPIILMTEHEYMLNTELVEKHNETAYPVILPVPDGISHYGIAMDKITANMERLK